tara:strand:- start:8525 stop:8869 length:345 start_codon:yes stop_codon:yes gene_type:complete
MDLDNICGCMSGMSINSSINEKLLSDLNLIISEIIKCGHYKVDIYDICVNCGHSLTWDQEYSVSKSDIEWLKTSGKNYFCETLNNYIKVNNIEDYNLVIALYIQLVDLFSLQIE